MNCVEKEVRSHIVAHYPDRPIIIGRCAHLTKPEHIHIQQGRGQCQARNMCYLTLQPDSIVHSIIIYDEQKGKATGVRIINAHAKKMPPNLLERNKKKHSVKPAKCSKLPA